MKAVQIVLITLQFDLAIFQAFFVNFLFGSV